MNRLENITSTLSVRILHGHWIRHDSHWFEEKTKEHYTLWSIVSGTVKITAEGRDFFARKGDAVLFYPGCRYSACTDLEGCQFIFIFFTFFTFRIKYSRFLQYFKSFIFLIISASKSNL